MVLDMGHKLIGKISDMIYVLYIIQHLTVYMLPWRHHYEMALLQYEKVSVALLGYGHTGNPLPLWCSSSCSCDDSLSLPDEWMPLINTWLDQEKKQQQLPFMLLELECDCVAAWETMCPPCRPSGRTSWRRPRRWWRTPSCWWLEPHPARRNWPRPPSPQPRPLPSSLRWLNWEQPAWALRILRPRWCKTKTHLD